MFTALLTKLQAFAGSFGSFATRRLSEDEKLIAQWGDEIKKADLEINGLKNQINMWMVSMGITVFGTLAASVLFPGFAVFAVSAGVALLIAEGVNIGVLVSQIHEWDAYKNTFANKIADVQKEVNTIHQCQQNLVTVRGSTIPNICTALGSFEDVWQAVKSRCVQFTQQLKYADGALKLKDDADCKTFLEKGKSIYGPIGRAMVKYGELQATTNRGGYVVEKHVPTNLLAWGHSDPVLKKKVEGVFISLNFPITTV